MSEAFLGTKLTMNLGPRSYEIILRRGALQNLYQFANLNRRVAVVTDNGVPPLYARQVADQCREAAIITVPQGEASKSLKTLESVLQQMLDAGLGRGDLVIAVGGGVVGDLAGFAAAVYMRGIDFINCPTTTLSMIDSSIGGKTAVDLGDTKNVVGAFWQPRLVIVDADTLATLPRRHFVNGLAEAVKAGLLADPELFGIFENGDVDAEIDAIIYRSLKFKKGIVEQDETEHGARRALNFGHTIGHALEKASGYTLGHGAAVAVGMVYATKLAEQTGLCAGMSHRLSRCLEKYGLPVSPAYPWQTLVPLMELDKKNAGSRAVTMVLPLTWGQCQLVAFPPEELLARLTEIDREDKE